MPKVTANPLQYYVNQSSITNPRKYVYMLGDLPVNIPALCEVLRGTILHTETASRLGVELTSERFSEIYTRYVDLMLARVQELDDRPIKYPRKPDKRLVGICRDQATLLCTLLRHQGIPARVRFGFSAYFEPNFYFDHVVSEFWQADEQRWTLVDPGQDEYLRQLNKLTFDPHDIPRDQFITAGKAWQLCRAGKTKADRFGFSPDRPELCGMWYIQSYLVHDFAALNKMELLIRDRWGLGDCGPDGSTSEEDLALLDRVAALTLADVDTSNLGEAFSEMRILYENNDRLRVPPIVTCYCYDGSIQKIDLTR